MQLRRFEKAKWKLIKENQKSQKLFELFVYIWNVLIIYIEILKCIEKINGIRKLWKLYTSLKSIGSNATLKFAIESTNYTLRNQQHFP